jgi:hypothetical protein
MHRLRDWLRTQMTFGMLATGILVTAPLLWYASRPVRLVEIHLVPSYAPSAQIPCKTITTRTHGGPAFFDFTVENIAPEVHKVTLQVTPESNKASFKQSDDYPVENGRASGRAQLGSDAAPISHDEGYSFRLSDKDVDATLVAGSIFARVDEVASPSPWMLGALGTLASMIQVLSSISRGRQQQAMTSTND